MEQTFLPYTRQQITEEDIEAVARSLRGKLITRGETVEAFEKAVAEGCGARFAVAFNSGTAALDAAYFAAEVEAADRVFTTPNTFIGTVVGALKAKAQLKLVDIDETGNLSLEKLSDCLNLPASRGRDIVVPVHFGGIAVDMQALDRMIRSPETVVIEDAAHAIGSTYPSGEKVGSCAYSLMTIFSFHPAKQITTGEGGMVTTNCPEHYERLKLYRNNGIVRDKNFPWFYEARHVTGNYHLTDFQAALGLSQFQRLDEIVKQRGELAKLYREKLAGCAGVSLFPEACDPRTCYHLFPAFIDPETYGVPKKELMAKLEAKGIGTQVHYIPLYKHPIVNEGKELAPYFPAMEAFFARELSLPFYVGMSESDVDIVVEALKSYSILGG
ncbi:MAG: DegT/DnrJ/EryC1/StrS family aminotransferase [Chlamydiia bacterium]|nr:DegT/DnrJ/EryC1/StrS family aminotransferase [Chlamydiia bacterium]